MPAESPPPDPRPSGARRLLRSTGVVGFMTLLSRVLGLVRDVVYARMFGASLVMDAFFVAFKIPNIFRRFFAEGAFSQSFVPVFAEYREQRSEQEARELASRAAGTLGLVLFGVTALGVVAAPVVIAVFAPGFATGASVEDAGRYALAVEMLRFTFPYLLFISLVALAGGILNTYQRFAAPAFAPVLLNLVLIVFAAFVAPVSPNPGLVLALGVFCAGLVQLLFMLPFLGRIRMLSRPRWGWRDPGVRRILQLMAPAIFGSSVAQLNILFDTLIASFLAAGSISWLYYSDRLMEFPLGVFGIALATVILPNLSKQHATDAPDEFSATLDWALRLVTLIALPAAAGLLVLAGPMLVTIFFGGAFDRGDVDMALLSLLAYTAGLPGFILIKVLAPGFFARQDTRTPVRIGIIALVSNMFLNVLFVVPWAMSGLAGPHAGLALATACSAWLNAGLLFRRLRQDGAYRPASGWGRLLLQVLVACGVMAMCLSYFMPGHVQWLEAGLGQRWIWLLGLVCGGGLIYFAALWAVGVRPRALRMHSDPPSL